MAKLTEAQRHPLRIAASDARGCVEWLGPDGIEKQKWMRLMYRLDARGLVEHECATRFYITPAGRLALSKGETNASKGGQSE